MYGVGFGTLFNTLLLIKPILSITPTELTYKVHIYLERYLSLH